MLAKNVRSQLDCTSFYSSSKVSAHWYWRVQIRRTHLNTLSRGLRIVIPSVGCILLDRGDGGVYSRQRMPMHGQGCTSYTMWRGRERNFFLDPCNYWIQGGLCTVHTRYRSGCTNVQSKENIRIQDIETFYRFDSAEWAPSLLRMAGEMGGRFTRNMLLLLKSAQLCLWQWLYRCRLRLTVR